MSHFTDSKISKSILSLSKGDSPESGVGVFGLSLLLSLIGIGTMRETVMDSLEIFPRLYVYIPVSKA